ncbi:MAG: NYN domain-containing protein [Planctomycetaceae bacterium]|nr:NYN domain-containing protein [Planctomycetaceae bacterium]
MARLFLIIDGYNLMHAAGYGRRHYALGGLERARNRLLTELARQVPSELISDSVIVFDAAEAEARDEQDPKVAAPKLRVQFSEPGTDADSLIENMLAVHSSPKQILVVSSDHRLHKAASRRQSRCIDSEEFLRILESPGTALRQLNPQTKTMKGKKPGTTVANTKDRKPVLDNEKLADVVDEFLQIDVSEIKKSVRKEKR